MTALAGLIDLVELDLRDTGNTNWSAAEITQHIRRALRDIEGVTPRRTTTTLTLAAAGREVSLSGVSGLLRVYDVWYPYSAAAPEYPPMRPRWELIADDTLLLLVDDEPAACATLRLFYTAPHTIDGLDSATSTTLSPREETSLVLGATAFCAQQYAQDAIGEVSPSGMTPAQLEIWAARRESLYRWTLDELRRAQVLLQDPRVPWVADDRDDGRGGVV